MSVLCSGEGILEEDGCYGVVKKGGLGILILMRCGNDLIVWMIFLDGCVCVILMV